MSIKLLVGFWLTCWMLVSGLFAQTFDTIDSSENQLMPQRYFSISYWNDDFLYRQWIENIIGKSDDDRVTAAFSGQLGTGEKVFKLQYLILTSRGLGQRTDLISGEYWKRVVNNKQLVALGVGVMANGDFGGSGIQNAYHRWRGDDEVFLEYAVKPQAGIYFAGDIKSRIWKNQGFDISIYGQMSGGTMSVSRVVKTGIESTQHFYFTRLKAGGELRIYSGYSRYFAQGLFYESLFWRGFTCGGRLNLHFLKKYLLSGWITSNQYGHYDYHFGMMIGYRFTND